MSSIRWLRYIYSLEEETAVREACPAEDGSDEHFHLHYSPLLHWINTQKRHGINAPNQRGPPTVVTISEMKNHIADSLWESNTPEAMSYGLRGSMRSAENPVVRQTVLAVSGKTVSNRMPQHQTTSP
ncbi:Testis-expressed sequence 38 protein [Sciurus carolinensis]|uniref:Testis-expressed sequence 38 protein n=1 Tax=Sciurus carolinensis TaxID=30640 RepID=A0AA41MV75_SCICA|nr:Testis-expressed sequence 38 protein [Sciurus carolinensis]